MLNCDGLRERERDLDLVGGDEVVVKIVFCVYCYLFIIGYGFFVMV